MSGRIFIVGDVHGCLTELNELIASVVPQPDDQWWIVGDLVDRGPDSRGVIRRVMETENLHAIAGNHEELSLRLREKFIKLGEWSAKAEPWMKIADEKEWEFLDSLPLIHRIPEHNIVLVHGGFFPRFFELYGEIGDPRNPWRRGGGKRMSRMRRFLRVRNVDEKGDMVALNDTDRDKHPHWSAVYDGREGLAVFGHDPQLNWDNIPESLPLETPHALGIDTGCVFGGRLTALVISPDGKRSFISVAAHQEYAPPMTFDDDTD